MTVQRRKEALKVCWSKIQEEKKNEEISLIKALNPRNTRFVAVGPPPSPPPRLATREVSPTEPKAPPCVTRDVSLPQRLVRAPNLARKHPYPEQGSSFEAISQKQSKPRGPARELLLGSYSIFHFRLTELEEVHPLVQGGSSENDRSCCLHYCHPSPKLGRGTGPPQHPTEC